MASTSCWLVPGLAVLLDCACVVEDPAGVLARGASGARQAAIVVASTTSGAIHLWPTKNLRATVDSPMPATPFRSADVMVSELVFRSGAGRARKSAGTFPRFVPNRPTVQVR